MVLDITDDFLRSRLANVQKSVVGERTLIQKLLPAISLRERWLEREFLPESMFHEEGIEPLLMDAVAYAALYDAFPMLDVLLTPNGLATVGNSNLVPASEARSREARKSLATLLFMSLEALLSELRRNDAWLKSSHANVFARSLVVSLHDMCALDHDRTADSFELAKTMQLKAAIAEDKLAERYISRDLMVHLRRGNLAGSLSEDECHVVTRIRDAVSLMIEYKTISHGVILEVVNYIRERPAVFPLWHSSRVALTFIDHRFKNERRSGGFFL